MKSPQETPAPTGAGGFDPSYPGLWPDVAPELWNDWHWQMRHRIRTLEQARRHLELTPAEHAGIAFAGDRLAFAVTPHFFNLVERDDPEGPIRRQVIPRAEEALRASWERDDPCGEDRFMPVPGLVHRYPDRALLLLTGCCAAYCRYCTRSRRVGGGGNGQLRLDDALRYLGRHTEIRDVLLSGGDPLLLSDRRLDQVLGRLRAIPHIEFVRIGTRIPIFLPQRITLALCGILRRHHPLWMSIHANHPRELTAEARGALGRLADHGIPLGNQSVLLSGVNDDPNTMRRLVHRLLLCRVRPYYLYQCDLIRGSAHLRAPVARGLEIIEALRGHTTGYAVPQFVIDAPEGGGKIPINPEWILQRDERGIVVRNHEGRTFEYPEAPAQALDTSTSPTRIGPGVFYG